MRQIALDTETTGIGHADGHRVIEIGCIELINRKFTGNHFHVYLNPERQVDEGAFRVHGISQQFLQDKPLFREVCPAFMDFIKDADLIIHNAPFDLGFLNTELKRLKWTSTIEESGAIIDTLVMARQKHPGQRNSLDALCKRYHVDNSNRQLHGALLDAEILAFVYLAMTGGQTELFAEQSTFGAVTTHDVPQPQEEILTSSSPVYLANEEELQRHHAFIESIATKNH